MPGGHRAQSVLTPSRARTQYYRGAEAAIVVYDITSFVRRAAAAPLAPPQLPFPAPISPAAVPRCLRPLRLPAVCLRCGLSTTGSSIARASQESFEGAKKWVGELKTYGQPNVVIALAANKCDLEDYRVVSEREGKAYAHEQEMAYFETSAKTAYNVRQMFVELGAPPAVRGPLGADRCRPPLLA